MYAGFDATFKAPQLKDTGRVYITMFLFLTPGTELELMVVLIAVNVLKSLCSLHA